MKYLVMQTITEAVRSLTGSVLNQILTVNLEVAKRQKEQGNLLEMYYTFDGHAGVSIYECKNHEELMKCIFEFPGIGQWELNVYPLIDYDETSVGYVLQNIESAGEAQPGGTVK